MDKLNYITSLFFSLLNIFGYIPVFDGVLLYAKKYRYIYIYLLKINPKNKTNSKLNVSLCDTRAKKEPATEKCIYLYND